VNSSCDNPIHPDIWTFIKGIMGDEQTTFVDNVQSQAGSSSKVSRKNDRDYAAKLRYLVNAYDLNSSNSSFDVVDYLEGIAHNI